MSIEEKILHYDVIENTAHKIEKVANELSILYKNSFISNERIELRKKHLKKYFDELTNLINKNN